jgi:hypothetical protein
VIIGERARAQEADAVLIDTRTRICHQPAVVVTLHARKRVGVSALGALAIYVRDLTERDGLTLDS